MPEDETHERKWIHRVATAVGALGSIIAMPVSIYSCDTAREAQRLNVVGAEVQWQSLLDGYREVDEQIWEFEDSKHMQRNGEVASTAEGLDRNLEELKVSDSVARLYRRRFDKYESLKNAAAQYEPFESRMSNMVFNLPTAPRLPRPTLSGVSISGGSIN